MGKILFCLFFCPVKTGFSISNYKGKRVKLEIINIDYPHIILFMLCLYASFRILQIVDQFQKS